MREGESKNEASTQPSELKTKSGYLFWFALIVHDVLEKGTQWRKAMHTLQPISVSVLLVAALIVVVASAPSSRRSFHFQHQHVNTIKAVCEKQRRNPEE